MGRMLQGLVVASLAGGAAAQLNVQWVKFAQNPTRLAMSPLALTSSSDEASFAVGDLDLDGWADVAVAREEPCTPGGKRANVLLMNDLGVLRDKTAQYAALSDVPGNQGFLTPAGDRDVELGDVDGDGWPEVLTARTLHDGEPKATSHPRIYRNLGETNGVWQGLLHEDARIPQLLTVGGLAVAPRFVALSVGDVDNDGDVDLHFVDQDQGTPSELGGADINDRLLINDGLGWFTDESFARMTSAQLSDNYGINTFIEDMNGDGAAEIVHGRDAAVIVAYNDAANPGYFQALGDQSVGTDSPYAFDVGDLNQDGRIDLAFEDDGNDRYRLALGVDALGKVIWGPLKNFSYVSGGDEGFSGNTHVTDLDANGWNDVIICDVDIDVQGCDRRTHIFHNTGSVPGESVTLKEEAELTTTLGWKGVVGMTSADLIGTFDVASADFDRDGDLDMLVGRCAGSFFWENQSGLPHCQADLGHGGPGAVQLSICGQELNFEGAQATFALSGAAALQPVFLAIGASSVPTPLKGGMLVPSPPLAVLLGPSDAAGALQLPVTAAGSSTVTVYLQAIVKSGPVFEFSNALELVIGF